MRFLLSVLLYVLMAPAWASAVALDIPAQPLDTALARLSEATGLQLVYAAETTEGLYSREVRGAYEAQAALALMLADSGLSARQTGPDTVLIEFAQDVHAIGVLRVAGVAQRRRQGDNGSSDVLATEGSKRYAARGAGVGSPYPQALKDTPRSVSVLGLQQMQDQAIDDLSEALRQFSAVASSGSLDDSLSVSIRGRPLAYYQLDGGAAIPLLAGRISGDLSAYDRVELLNGSDGIGNGFVTPSGLINLVRKRPLDHAHMVVEARAGSWDAYRGMLDVNAPSIWGGRVRSRAVVAGTDREGFSDRVSLQRQSYYGVIEADLSADTVMRVGGQLLDQRGTPWEGAGLPLLTTGDLIALSRGETLMPDWVHEHSTRHQSFISLEHRLNTDWNARLAVDDLRESRDVLTANLFGTAVNPETGDGLFLVPGFIERRNDYTVADLRLNGRVRWFAREHVVSVSLERVDSDLLDRRIPFLDVIPINTRTYDPTAVPAPVVERGRLSVSIDDEVSRQSASVSLTLNPVDALSVIGTWRWSEWSTQLHRTPSWETLPRRASVRQHGLSYLGATFALNERWNLYGSWAEAFIVRDTAMVPNGGIVAPVVGENHELGAKYASPDQSLQTRVTLYRTERSQFPRQLSPDPDSVFCCYDNNGSDRDRIQGFEVEATGFVLPHWQIVAGYTYADLDYRYAESAAGLSDQSTRGATFDLVTPRHALRLRTLWEPRLKRLSGLKIGAGVRAQNESLVGASDGFISVSGRSVRQDAYVLVDALLGWQFHPQWQATLNGRNLFDREYFHAVSSGASTYYGEPRNLMLTLRWSL